MFKAPPTDERLIESIEDQKKQCWASRFGFVNETKGFRPGFLTGLLATTGAGKSTLNKSFIVDTSKQEKCFVWLSEEDVENYCVGIACDDSNYNRENIVFFEEKSIDSESRGGLGRAAAAFQFMKDRIVESNCKIIFIDNLTTSALYCSLNPQGQTNFIAALGRLAKENHVAIVYLLHTEACITEGYGKFIEGENVRGCKQSFQMADYFYILQRFPVGNGYFTFIRIRKHRFSRIKSLFYELNYKDFCYKSDSQISFDGLNDAFKSRNYLGRSNKNEKPKERSFHETDKDW